MSPGVGHDSAPQGDEMTTARVVVGEEASEEFEVKIGLRQGSVLSPLLFIAVLELISRKTAMKDAIRKLLHADILALVANDKIELQETLAEWNGLFTRHGLTINLEKTEVLTQATRGKSYTSSWRGRN